jgi:xanthine dehydrogenase iron-sulfur cluster and FAD-binding subunit A
MNEKIRREIPTNSYFVKTTRQSKHGTWLYVEIGDKIEKIEIPIENYDKNYVYIKITKDGKKLVSETPFRAYGKKKKKN